MSEEVVGNSPVAVIAKQIWKGTTQDLLAGATTRDGFLQLRPSVAVLAASLLAESSTIADSTWF